MTPLFWLASYAAVGLCLGLVIAIFDTVKTWKKGEDQTLGKFGVLCGFVLLMAVLWPVVAIVAVYDWIQENWHLGRDTVILKGSRSAKVYRALRD